MAPKPSKTRADPPSHGATFHASSSSARLFPTGASCQQVNSTLLHSKGSTMRSLGNKQHPKMA